MHSFHRLISTAILLLILAYPQLKAKEARIEADDFETIRGSELLSVRSLAQDSQKRVWIGTDKNLYSYDGYTLTLHYDKNGNNDHLQINSMVFVGDSLFLGCPDGIVIYDRIAETFEPAERISGIEVFSLKKEGDTVWIGSEIGLFRYDIPERTFTHVSFSSTDKPGNIRSIELVGGELYTGSRQKGQLGRYPLHSIPSFIPFPNEIFPRSFSSIDAIAPIDDNYLLIGTSSSLQKVDIRRQKAELVSTFSWVKTISRSEDGFLIGTDNGLFLYDGNTVSNLLNAVVWSILKDADGNIWFGSDTGLMLCRNRKLINNTDIAPLGANNLYGNIVGDKEGNVFAGSSYGILSFNTRDGKEPPYWFKMGDPDYPLNHNKVRRIVHNARSGDIWAATAAGIVQYDKENRKFITYSVPNVRLSDTYDILFDGDSIWVANYKGVLCIQDHEIIKSYTTSDGLSSNRTAQIQKDAEGNLWVMTIDRNLFIINTENNRVEKFQIPGVGSGKCDQVYSDSAGDIWIALGPRVLKVHQRKVVADLSLISRQGMEITNITEVGTKIWLCSTDGIFIVDKNGQNSKHFYTESIYSGIYFDPFRNSVLLGTLDRIDRILLPDVNALIERSESPIYITKITTDSGTVIPFDEYADGRLTLPHRSGITIFLSSFDYVRETSQHFKFNLGGNASQWYETTGSGNEIFLPDLNPKTYKIYATSINSTVAGDPILTLKILRPWYFSPPALLFYFLVVAGLLYFIINYYLMQKRVKMERLQKAKEIAQAKSKVNFFADIAHEIKTPLSLIVAPVSRLLQESNDEKQKKTLQLIHDNAMKLNSLVRFSMDYYNQKTEVSGNVLSSSVEIISFVRYLFQSFEESFPNLEFIFNTELSELQVDIDVLRVETILSNIISNACKYTPDKGSVLLSIAQPKEGEFSIRVTDTGVGIPDDELPLVFQRYYQSSRTKGSKMGTGLGLSIVKSYVDSLNGTIHVSSDETGTSFLITLPIEGSSVGKEEAVTEIGLKTHPQKKTIVIVDDNKPICDFLKELLQDNYRCLVANNGSSGLKLCLDALPDLIISDIAMPGMDGLQMCRKIRENASLATIPIILLTAKDDRETEKTSIDLNVDAFLGKPFESDILLARVEQLIHKRQQVREHLRMEMIAQPQAGNNISADERFLLKVTKLIEEHLDESDLSVKRLCALGGFNEKTLYRKILRLVGIPTVEYIRSIRIKKAALLLQNGNFSISEAMYMVGFNNSSYFTRAFKASFGMTPTEYQKSFKS